MQQQKNCNKNERQSAHTYAHRNKQNKQHERMNVRMNGRTTAERQDTSKQHERNNKRSPTSKRRMMQQG